MTFSGTSLTPSQTQREGLLKRDLPEVVGLDSFNRLRRGDDVKGHVSRRVSLSEAEPSEFGGIDRNEGRSSAPLIERGQSRCRIPAADLLHRRKHGR